MVLPVASAERVFGYNNRNPFLPSMAPSTVPSTATSADTTTHKEKSTQNAKFSGRRSFSPSTQFFLLTTRPPATQAILWLLLRFLLRLLLRLLLRFLLRLLLRFPQHMSSHEKKKDFGIFIMAVFSLTFTFYCIFLFFSIHYHIAYICFKISRNTGMTSKVRYYLSTKQLMQLYYNLIYPYISNAMTAWVSE